MLDLTFLVITISKKQQQKNKKKSALYLSTEYHSTYL